MSCQIISYWKNAKNTKVDFRLPCIGHRKEFNDLKILTSFLTFLFQVKSTGLSRKIDEMDWRTEAIERRMQDMAQSSVMMNRVLLATQEAIEELRYCKTIPFVDLCMKIKSSGPSQKDRSLWYTKMYHRQGFAG